MNELKNKLREKLLFERKNLSREYIEKSDELIYQKLISLESYKNAKNIFCYLSIDGEVSTIKFLQKALIDNKRVFVPLCLKKGIMEAREIMDLSELKEGKFGILEPIKNSIKINFEEIDLSIIPCISANKEGYRLGYGGGYYDRFFENKSIKNSFILCREKMIYDNIPFEKHDIKFEHVLTDKN
ncbi:MULTISPECIES: 5-formyltetrahydrofolate cyclo-ligase [Helcococcus]|uniref:5-formyltetrahydrofolate cyclo-ligase n=1 Tax=Helcococcus bovis TaxID=3153252 RepID=A0ABW9F5I8_9FIRM